MVSGELGPVPLARQDSHLERGSMNIVFLTLAYPFTDEARNLYSDLMDEFASRGHKIQVYCPDERRSFGEPVLITRKNVRVICIPTGRVTKASFLIKAINTILLESRVSTALRKFQKEDVDAVIYSTPPITFFHSVALLQRKYGCITYLLLKDIFPQNAIDVGLIRANSVIHRLLRKKEQSLYKISNLIGCMSPANVEYFLLQNKSISSEKVHICPNAIMPRNDNLSIRYNKNEDQYSENKTLRLVCGGNIGKPQGVPFILEALKQIDTLDGVSTQIVGSGTDFDLLRRGIETYGLKNVQIIPAVPMKTYIEILNHANVGLLFLDKRFTVPNFPSRVLDYLEASLPVIACTDAVSDIKKEICEAGAGLWCSSGDAMAFRKAVEKMQRQEELRLAMGVKGREILQTKYSVVTVASEMLERISKLLQ